MLKSLYPHIDWDSVRVAGFDLDGTLYDEAEFITQVYEPISGRLATACGAGQADIHEWMLRRWLEKGSSYNRIFGEVLTRHGITGPVADAVIDECLSLFREFRPALTLPVRVSAVLDLMSEQFSLFLVSDGSAALQTEKIRALGLNRWFSPENVGISGCHGPGFAKPATRIIGTIGALKCGTSQAEAVYFGDREVDAQFASAAGFQYIRVSCMIPLAR